MCLFTCPHTCPYTELAKQQHQETSALKATIRQLRIECDERHVRISHVYSYASHICLYADLYPYVSHTCLYACLCRGSYLRHACLCTPWNVSIHRWCLWQFKSQQRSSNRSCERDRLPRSRRMPRSPGRGHVALCMLHVASHPTLYGVLDV